MKFAFVSHALPPSWSGQAMIISRLLTGLTADDYCLISAQPKPPESHAYSEELLGAYYHLPHEITLNRGYRFGLKYARTAVNFLTGIRRRASHITEIIQREGCGAIVACSGDLEDLPAAALAARRAGVPFYAYVFDYYSHQFVAPEQRLLARLVEPRVLKRADGIIVTNEILRHALYERYQLKATVLHNPCDVDEFDALARTSESDRNNSGEVRIVYTGAIYEAHFDAFRNLLRAIELLGREDVRLHLYTAQSPAELEANGVSGPVTFHPHIISSAIPAVQNAADILFLPLAFTSPYPELVRTSAPSKQPEYLAACRPILVHAPSDTFISSYARKHDCGLVVDVCNPQLLAAGLHELLSDVSLCKRLSHELEREIPRTTLLDMRDVRVSPEGLLFRQARILPESYAFPFMLEEWRAQTFLKFLTRNYLLRKHVTFERDAIWIVDNWSPGYFHWLADALTRLFTIRDRASELVLLLPHQYKEIEFVHSSLKPFNLQGIEFIGKAEVTLCRRLMIPTHTAPSGHHNEEIIKGVRNLLLDYYGENKSREADGRFYISRKRATKRRIVNEQETADVVRAFGFRILYPEEMTFAEQVRTFSSARYVVSNHGGGLTNMLFMSPGSNVLELRHQTDNVNNCYFTMASALGLNYFYQACKPEKAGEDAHTAHLCVDVPQLRENLKKMLSS